MSTPTVDLDLPTDAQLGTAARPDPQAAAAPLNGMRPDELREHSRRMIASGAAADRAFAATTAARQQVGRGFTNDGAPVYDGAAARPAPEIGDMGTLAYTAGRRLAAAADELDDTLTAVRRALEGLQDDLALRRRGFAAEVDAARGPGGLIPVDAAAGLLARRAAVALRLQESVDDCGRTIAARVARFEDVLVGVLPPVRELVARGPTRDAATAATDPRASAGPFARLEGSTAAPTGPTAEVQPLPDLRPPDRGFTPGFEGGPLITLPAPDLGLGVQDGPGSGQPADALGPSVVTARPADKPASPGSINQEIQRGRRGVPRTVIRADQGRIKFEQPHVHFADGSALNQDGTWKHGGRPLTNAEKGFLIDHGWTLPNE